MLEEFSRNINRQSAPKYVGLTMACRYFGIVQQSRLKAALEKFSPLAEADILAATNDRELRLPKQFRIRPRTGETFVVSNDSSTLKIMLQTARQSLDAKTAKGRAVAKESSSCFWDSVCAYKSWAALQPSHLQLGGSYVLPHVLRKHALAWHMQRWQSPSAEAFIAHLFELDGRMHEQPQISTMDKLLEISPDQRAILSKMPPHQTPTKLSRLLGCPLILLPCFACLWQEACDKLSAECETCLANPKLLAEAAAEYIRANGCAPCPFVLVKHAASLIASTSPRPAAADRQGQEHASVENED